VQTPKTKANKKDFLDVTEFIRSIQRSEGDPDCFRRPEGDCDRLDCSWRKTPKEVSPSEKRIR
jgi:hypothetical protein